MFGITALNVVCVSTFIVETAYPYVISSRYLRSLFLLAAATLASQSSLSWVELEATPSSEGLGV
ncbi:hypothetical protein BC834DRAFT_976587 [Gloeopeniophorella convolvens]|nr:hypothetical protein BC834DRAFT_976587 [Gloeopeniophorella convolvens]